MKKKNIPEHLKKEMDSQKDSGVYERLSTEDKKRFAKAAAKIKIANDFYVEWKEDTEPRLKSMGYEDQYEELSGLLEAVRAHKKRYGLEGVVKIDAVEMEVVNAMEVIEKRHPELKDNLSFSAIGLFCQAMARTDIIPQKDLSNENYCKSICEKYSLPYKDNVRQYFSGSPTRMQKNKIIKLILPKIADSDSQKIEAYLIGNTDIHG